MISGRMDSGDTTRRSGSKPETHWYVITVTAYPGAEFTRSEPIRFAGKRSASDACEQLQVDFDADCDPKRAYVCDADMVPVKAGGERRVSVREALHAV